MNFKEVTDSMESGGKSVEGSIWALEQRLDQPMDEEAGKLKNINTEKVVYIYAVVDCIVNVNFP